MMFRLPDQLLLPWSPKYTISTDRAADILGCSRDTVERMIEAGELKAYKLRPSPTSPWRINYDSVIEYLEGLHERNGLEKRF